MKILQVCPSITRKSRGAERFAIQLTHQLLNRNCDVLLVSGHKTDGRCVENIGNEKLFEIRNKVARKLLFDYYNIFAIFQFRRILIRFRPDIIHFHGVYGLSSYLVKMAIDRARTFVTFHDTWYTFYDPPVKKVGTNLTNRDYLLPLALAHQAINRYFLKEAGIITPAKWVVEWAGKCGFENQFDYIPAGVDVDVKNTTYEKELLWIGAIEEEKGLSDVIEVLSRVSKQNNWTLKVIGDGAQKKRLQKRYSNVVFVGWDSVEKYLTKGSIMVISSRVQETGPLVLLEGMSHGVCVVGVARGGVEEKLVDGETGFLYHTCTQLEALLQYLIDNEEEVHRVGQNARKFVRHAFTWENNVDKHLELYSRDPLSNEKNS